MRPIIICAVVLSIAPFFEASAEELPQENIVYTVLRPANWDVYLFSKPGGEPQRLTDDPDLDYNAMFSPDGRWIVFCSERRGNPDLYLLDAQKPGSPKLLTHSDAMEDAPAFSPDGRMLAFVSSRGGNADVFLILFDPENPADDSSAKNLTQHAGGDFNPAFSPDGEWIAFSSDRDGYKASEIYVMRADGSEQRRLTEADGWDGSPVWSPDGKSIYFYSERDGASRIYRMDRDGGNPVAVSPAGRQALSPALTPDGRLTYGVLRDEKWQIVSVALDGDDPDERLESDAGRQYWEAAYDPHSGRMICHGAGPVEGPIVENSTPGPFLANAEQRVRLPDRELRVWAVRGYFPALRAGSEEVVTGERFERIVISRLDGTEMRQLFRPASDKTWRPTWSADGQWLAATAGPTFGKPDESADIWKFRSDASDAVNLTADSPGNDAFPDFSPDGRSIVFRSGRDGDHEIFLMDCDGKDVRQLTENDAVDTMPAFAPAGDRIAFTSNRTGDYEVYVMDLAPDGRPGETRRITESPGRDTHPKFSPDCRWLVIASERGGMNDESPLIPVFNPQPYGDIYAIRLEDGLVVRLTHNKWEDGTPAWGAGGTTVTTN